MEELGSSQSDQNSEDFVISERDPTGRYVRSDEIMGENRVSKTVYKAFDEESGLEVAWVQVDISNGIIESDQKLANLHSETHLLESLKHRNVTRCYHSWVDNKNKTFNMITEILTSGNLQQYCKKHTHLEVKVIKRWARQILQGLSYLHSYNPPIVHKELNCENIFVNGNSGTVKIGGLGLATARSLEDNQLDDIYSFGMCMLQMVTRECDNSTKVGDDPELRQFIEKCLAPMSERFTAIDLLNDPFLATSDSSPVSCSTSLTESVCSSVTTLSTTDIPVEVVKGRVTEMNKFKLQGKLKDKDSIAMTLWIADLKGIGEKAEFVYFLQTDTVVSVTEEMVKELNLSTKDAALIAHIMDEVIAELVPGFECHTASVEGEAQGDQELILTDISGSSSNMEEKHADDGSEFEVKCSNQNVEYYQRKSDKKWRKKLPYKAFGCCLRKLLFHCGRQF